MAAPQRCAAWRRRATLRLRRRLRRLTAARQAAQSAQNHSCLLEAAAEQARSLRPEVWQQQRRRAAPAAWGSKGRKSSRPRRPPSQTPMRWQRRTRQRRSLHWPALPMVRTARARAQVRATTGGGIQSGVPAHGAAAAPASAARRPRRRHQRRNSPARTAARAIRLAGGRTTFRWARCATPAASGSNDTVSGQQPACPAQAASSSQRQLPTSPSWRVPAPFGSCSAQCAAGWPLPALVLRP